MAFLLSLTQSQTLKALRAFLLDILPGGAGVYLAQPNRVAEPTEADFVMMTPILRVRISTNVDTFEDLAFIGGVAGTVLTVTSVSVGLISADTQIAGTKLAPSTVVGTQISGQAGGVGTYHVTPSQAAVSALIWGGTLDMLQPTKVTMQLDVHGPSSADNAQLISTVLRDEYAVEFFASTGFDVTPLYAGEPRQTPFANEQQQIEFRWTVDAVLQTNPVVTTIQQFADQLVIGLIDVDVVYPPTGD